MSIVYINGQYLPMEQATISPMDRGFLFGDGVYEVVPIHNGKMIGFKLHIERMEQGLKALEINSGLSVEQWSEICIALYEKSGKANLAIYLQVSRGADIKRFHAYPEGIKPTIFAFVLDVPEPKVADKSSVTGLKVSTAVDLRWQRCNIKSTALLGNIMHFQYAYKQGKQETILFNDKDELTEGSAVNVFIVKNKKIITPPADSQILAGITRYILIESLRQNTSIPVEVRLITKQEVFDADEIWITSSSKEIAPVVEIDGTPIGKGNVGDVWEVAQNLYSEHKFGF